MFCCAKPTAIAVTSHRHADTDGTIETPFSPSSTDPILDSALNVPSAQTTAVRVVVRVRPFIQRESTAGKCTNILEIIDNQNLKVLDDLTGKNKASANDRNFHYDAVLSSTSTQSEAYEKSAQGIVLQVLKGYNGCIFAYGQTGSGKTFTMEGDFSTAGYENNTGTKTAISTLTTGSGIIPRMCNDLFTKLDNLSKGNGIGSGSTTTAATPTTTASSSSTPSANPKKRTSTVTPLDTNSNDKWVWSLSAQYVEIYMEKITDLLSPATKTTGKTSSNANDDSNGGGPLIRQKPSGEIFLEGVTSRPLRNESDIYSLLNEGQGRRTKGETNMNSASSRSHAILSISLTLSKVNGNSTNTNGNASTPGATDTSNTNIVNDLNLTRTCKLHLIDLAGSERAENTGATGTRLAEGAKINLSLTALGGVINALTSPGRQHIPYRDSKLTRLLQDSLGGNAFTCMICCVSPAVINYDETLASLRFADRASHVKNVARVGIDPTAARIAALVSSNQALRIRVSALEKCLQRHGIAFDETSLAEEERIFNDNNEDESTEGTLSPVATVSKASVTPANASGRTKSENSGCLIM